MEDQLLLNYEEAYEYVMNIRDKDPKTWSLVSFTFRKLELIACEGEVPSSSFDMLFFVKVLEKSMRCHDRIGLMLEGDTLEWPEELGL